MGRGGYGMQTEVLCLGELLIDFVSLDEDCSLVDSSGFLKAPGGAPANVAAGLARLGRKAGFIGKVGRDPLGQFLVQTLENFAVDVSQMRCDDYARTTLSFVANRSSGIRDCMFYRNPGADMRLSPEEISEEAIASAKVLHFGSVSLGAEPVRAATWKAIEYARKHGLLVSYDPNLRLSLWEDEEAARREIRSAFAYADIVKISEEEMEFVTSYSSLEAAAAYILAQGPKLVLITRGADGCYYTDGATSGSLDGHRVHVVETTGAGDAFVAGLLARLLERRDRVGRFVLSADEETEAAIRFANAAGALATTKVGAMPAMPTEEEVRQLLLKENKA
jgi:fructokinase